MSTNNRDSETDVRSESFDNRDSSKTADSRYAGWLKHQKKTTLPKMFRPMMHNTQNGIVVICTLNEKLAFYNYNSRTNKMQEIANFSLAEYFHVSGEFIHHQSFLINSRYIYLIKNSFPKDEEHIFFFDLQNKKLFPIKNDETRPETFRMNHTVNVHDLKFYFFGGMNFNLKTLNSLDIYNFETYKWEQVSTKGKAPEPRHSHNSFIVGSNLYILGGTKSTDFFSKEGCLDDFFMLNLTTLNWTPIKTTGNPPKCLSYNYTFQISQQHIIFVSSDRSKEVCDTSVTKFDVDHYQWQEMELVSATSEFRFGAGHCFDEETQVCLILGGMYLSKTESQSLTNEIDRIKISDSKDDFKGMDILTSDKQTGEIPIKRKDDREEPKSAEREHSIEGGDSESEEISFEELLEREKRLQEEEKTKIQPKKSNNKKKVSKKKRDSKSSKTDNLD